MRRTRLHVTLALVTVALVTLGVTLWQVPDRVELETTDLAGLEPLRTIPLPGAGFRFVISETSGRVASLNLYDGWICDSLSGEKLVTLRSPTGHSVGFVAFSKVANKFAFASGDGSLNISNLNDGSRVWSQQVTRLQFCDARFFPSGKKLAVSYGIWHSPGDERGAIRIFDTEDGTLLETIDKLPHSPMTLAISPDEQFLCSRLNYGGQVFVWDLRA